MARSVIRTKKHPRIPTNIDLTGARVGLFFRALIKHLHRLAAITTAFLALGFSGCCMSTWCHSPIEGCGKPNFVYPGVEEDLSHFPPILIDLPFSLVLDTIALPWDLYAVCIEGKPRYYYKKPFGSSYQRRDKDVVSVSLPKRPHAAPSPVILDPAARRDR